MEELSTSQSFSQTAHRIDQTRSPFAGLLNIAGGVKELIEKLKWENDRLLITPRNSAVTADEITGSEAAESEIQKLTSHLSKAADLALASQGNLFPQTVLTLLGGEVFP